MRTSVAESQIKLTLPGGQQFTAIAHQPESPGRWTVIYAPGAGSTGAVQLSAEYIVSANPDLIVLADTRCCGQSRAKVLARPGWATIAAVKKGAVAVIDDSIASRWGPRLVNFVNAVASALRTTQR